MGCHDVDIDRVVWMREGGGDESRWRVLRGV